jgi:putative membrane protein
MSRRRLISLAAGGLLASLAAMPVPTLQAQAKPAANTNPKPAVKEDVREDRDFLREFASNNLLEVDLGKIAKQRGTEAGVKDYGQRMVTDHSKANRELLNVAAKGGLNFQPGMGPRHEELVDKFQKADKKTFDRMYMNLMVENHAKDLSKLEDEHRSAHSTAVRNYVANMLPVIRQHLNMAQRIGAKVGADTTIGAVHTSLRK